jgi:hypothetical protein
MFAHDTKCVTHLHKAHSRTPKLGQEAINVELLDKPMSP